MHPIETMETLITSWQFWLIGYLLFIVLFFQGYKAAVRNAKRDGAATIVLQLIAGFSILLVAPFFEYSLATDVKTWLLFLAACIFYALNDRINTTVRKNLPVSTYSIISQMSTVFIIIIGFTAFGEPLLFNKTMGAILIVLGNVLLAYKKGGIVIDKHFALGILATLIISIAMSIDIGISENFNLPFYIFVTLFVPALMVAGAERIKFNEVKKEFNTPDKKYYLLTGISWGLAILFLLKAYQLGSVTTVVTLSGTSVLLNVLVAYLIFNERNDRLKKVIATVLVMVGVALTV